MEEHFFHISVNIQGFVHVSWANFAVHLFKGFIPYWESDTVGVGDENKILSHKNQHSIFQLYVRFSRSMYYNVNVFLSEIFYVPNICDTVIAEEID